MTQRLLPGFGYITVDNLKPGQYLIPGAGSITVKPPPILRRALILNGKQREQVSDSQVGKGFKPLVLYQNKVQQRVGSEGVPLVLGEKGVETLKLDETLLI